MTVRYRVEEGAITSFRDDYAFLSNFYASKIHLDGIEYPTLEHAFQAQKTSSMLTKIEIANAKTPAEAKRLGGAVELKPGWEDKKVLIMHEVLLPLKFSPSEHPGLVKRLLRTGDRQLVELNTWGDVIWGVRARVRNSDTLWFGKNLLGEGLMQIRTLLQRSSLSI